MKKAFMVLIGFALVAMVGCGSKPEQKVEVKEEPPVKTQPDFVVQEMSQANLPEWVKEPVKGDDAAEVKKSRYFISESEHPNKRLCLKSAETRATARIASEIAQFMKNTYAEATQGSEDEEVSEYMQEQLAAETQAFVVGSRIHKTYWEKRFYKEEMGAEEDKRVFKCFALVKIDKKQLKKAVDNARKKLIEGVRDPEVKQKTDKILTDISDKFNEVEQKVEVENEEG